MHGTTMLDDNESRMRDMFRKHVTDDYARVELGYDQLYVLQSYQDIPLAQSGGVPKNIGVGFVEGRMNSGFFWTLESKCARWNGKTNLLDALATYEGQREICFQCVWFDADKPHEHPHVAGKLDRNRRFAEIVYHLLPIDIAQTTTTPKTTVFDVGRK